MSKLIKELYYLERKEVPNIGTENKKRMLQIVEIEPVKLQLETQELYPLGDGILHVDSKFTYKCFIGYGT